MSARKRTQDFDQEQGTMVLPLFPLRLVLFPGQVLPLHIFEPRYRLMINQCIEEETPFGVVLMREDTPDWRHYQGDVTVPYDVGTTAHIRQVERLPDGRFNIIAFGLHRFKVRQLHFDQPYLQAEVEAFPLIREAAVDTASIAEPVHRMLQGYMDILAQVADAEVDVDDIPADPRTLAYLTASALQVPWEDKQELLAQPGLATLLRAERVLLAREQMLLRFMQESHARIEELAIGPTGYLLPN
jgi:Lon protease-like protein